MGQVRSASRLVRLFRNNRSQAVRIPADFELPGTEVLISRDGDRLVIEPVKNTSLLALLNQWEAIDDPWPDTAETFLSLRNVAL